MLCDFEPVKYWSAAPKFSMGAMWMFRRMLVLYWVWIIAEVFFGSAVMIFSVKGASVRVCMISSLSVAAISMSILPTDSVYLRSEPTGWIFSTAGSWKR